MARGGPDWGNPDYQAAGVQVDVADVADRLLGFSRIDSRGRVFYLDTFNEGALGWGLSSGLPDESVSAKVVQGQGFAGTVFVNLSPGLVVGNAAYIYRNMFLGSAKRIGVEFALTMPAPGVDFRAYLQYNVVGSVVQTADLKFDNAANEWQVRQNGGYARAFESAANYIGQSFMVVKMVADFEKALYERVLFGEVEYDVSAFSLWDSGLDNPGHALMTFQANSLGAGGGSVYLHYVILTKDEP